VANVRVAESFGHKEINRTPEEFRPLVSKEAFRLGVRQDDLAGPLHDDNRVRRGFEESAKLRLGFLAIADIANRAHRQRALLSLERAQTDLHRKFGAVAP
jgi:hypothetical protein